MLIATRLPGFVSLWWSVFDEGKSRFDHEWISILHPFLPAGHCTRCFPPKQSCPWMLGSGPFTQLRSSWMRPSSRWDPATPRPYSHTGSHWPPQVQLMPHLCYLLPILSLLSTLGANSPHCSDHILKVRFHFADLKYTHMALGTGIKLGTGSCLSPHRLGVSPAASVQNHQGSPIVPSLLECRAPPLLLHCLVGGAGCSGWAVLTSI